MRSVSPGGCSPGWACATARHRSRAASRSGTTTRRSPTAASSRASPVSSRSGRERRGRPPASTGTPRSSGGSDRSLRRTRSGWASPTDETSDPTEYWTRTTSTRRSTPGCWRACCATCARAHDRDRLRLLLAGDRARQPRVPRRLDALHLHRALPAPVPRAGVPGISELRVEQVQDTPLELFEEPRRGRRAVRRHLAHGQDRRDVPGSTARSCRACGRGHRAHPRRLHPGRLPRGVGARGLGLERDLPDRRVPGLQLGVRGRSSVCAGCFSNTRS